MGKHIQLLDCTLRDGGLGFEDSYKQGLFDKYFDSKTISDLAKNLSYADIDIIELGSVEQTSEDKKKYAIYQNIEEVSKTAPPKHKSSQIFAALYRGPDTPLDDIPNWREGYCDAVRVIIRYSALQKSLDFCKALSYKGYKVCVQPMLTMRYSDEEIKKLIYASNEMEAYALYFVDSYGYMEVKNIISFFEKYDRELLPSIRIGFHSHNNMNLAFSNAIAFLSMKSDRNIIVDSCILGMGQGAGNLQTELIADYLNKNFNKKYDFSYLLDSCEIIQKYLSPQIWGYSVETLLPAQNKAAYKYAYALRNKYGMSLKDIKHIMEIMPYDLKQRYTPENAEKAVNIFYKKF